MREEGEQEGEEEVGCRRVVAGGGTEDEDEGRRDKKPRFIMLDKLKRK